MAQLRIFKEQRSALLVMSRVLTHRTDSRPSNTTSWSPSGIFHKTLLMLVLGVVFVIEKKNKDKTNIRSLFSSLFVVF